MSFSMDVKTELIGTRRVGSCCTHALLYGMMIFGKNFSLRSVSLQTENEQLALLYKELAAQVCGAKVQIRKTSSGKCTAFIPDAGDRMKVLDCFGHNTNEITLKINRSNFNCSECEGSFFAGAFLSCGTISSPEKDYHLEFVVSYLNLSRSMMKLMSEFELEPKLTNRKGYSIIYFKESESIEDCLYRMGASDAAFRIMNIKVLKDFRNKANRMANCETANISRIIDACTPQIQAIEKIKKKKGLNYLSSELREIALLREANPEASLQELALMTADGLSRSGVNHRLKKIEKIAEEL